MTLHAWLLLHSFVAALGCSHGLLCHLWVYKKETKLSPLGSKKLDANLFMDRDLALCFSVFQVRYQKRKRVADERPRIRGQFVRKTASQKPSTGTESSD